MGWKHYQTVDHPKRELQVGRGLFGVHLPILHFNFPNPSNLQHFVIFTSISFPKNLFPKKIIPKLHKTRKQAVVTCNEISRDI